MQVDTNKLSKEIAFTSILYCLIHLQSHSATTVYTVPPAPLYINIPKSNPNIARSSDVKVDVFRHNKNQVKTYEDVHERSYCIGILSLILLFFLSLKKTNKKTVYEKNFKVVIQMRKKRPLLYVICGIILVLSFPRWLKFHKNSKRIGMKHSFKKKKKKNKKTPK